MTHLSAEEIRSWYEHGKADDRTRVIGHLAECETCRRALSTYAAAAEPETTSTLVSITDAVPRGYAAKKQAPPPARTFASLRPLYGLAAAAVVVVAVMWVTSLNRTPESDTVRSTELVGISPDGVANAAEFRFASPFRASRYRLTVRDAAGVLVASTDAPDTPITLDRSQRDRLVAGQEYSWVIAALDAAGETIAASAPKTFRYAP